MKTPIYKVLEHMNDVEGEYYIHNHFEKIDLDTLDNQDFINAVREVYDPSFDGGSTSTETFEKLCAWIDVNIG